MGTRRSRHCARCKRVYVLIQAKRSGLYRSDDGGDTWTLEHTDSRLTSRAWYFNSITVDPQNPDVIYIPNVAQTEISTFVTKPEAIPGQTASLQDAFADMVSALRVVEGANRAVPSQAV